MARAAATVVRRLGPADPLVSLEARGSGSDIVPADLVTTEASSWDVCVSACGAAGDTGDVGNAALAASPEVCLGRGGNCWPGQVSGGSLDVDVDSAKGLDSPADSPACQLLAAAPHSCQDAPGRCRRMADSGGMGENLVVLLWPRCWLVMQR